MADKTTNPVQRFSRPLTRTLNRGRGYEHHVAMCSRCHVAVAHWLQKRGCFQRYYCDDCVKYAAAWKQQQAAEAEGGE